MTATIDRPKELIMAQATAVTHQCYVLTVNPVAPLGNGQSIAVSPEGDVMYQAGDHAELITMEIDFERVKRNRERGIYTLGQPLKSFRDNQTKFSIYNEQHKDNTYLSILGKLEIPSKEN